jgi:hypothetical protein
MQGEGDFCFTGKSTIRKPVFSFSAATEDMSCKGRECGETPATFSGPSDDTSTLKNYKCTWTLLATMCQKCRVFVLIVNYSWFHFGYGSMSSKPKFSFDFQLFFSMHCVEISPGARISLLWALDGFH